MSYRLILSVLLILGGAFLATQMASTLMQIIFMSVAGILALTLQSLEETTSPSRSLMLQQREQDLLNSARTEAYQKIIGALAEPVLLVRDARVDTANKSAFSVLGDHIVGQDVRVAIRHPVASERLANPNTIHMGDPILLVGVGNAEQRWELRIQSVSENLKLVHLSDRSSRFAAEQMRTDFVANASHELRTPIAAIKGFVETLQDPDAGGDLETRDRFLQIMYDEADRMQRLIEDLMSLSRIEAERFQPPEDSVDLGKLIFEVRNFFLHSREKSEDQMVVSLFEGMPKVRGDYAQLSQLLHNLVSNAFKYGGSAKPIEIHTTPNRSGSMIRLSVTDHGDGIAAEDIPRLTERFYRIDKGRSKAIGGTGLGLSIVKNIAERHGGRLEITSEVGKGSSFSVLLPVAENS